MREQKIQHITWISIIKPTADDIEELQRRFPEINSLIIEDILSATLRPHVENYETMLYAVLHFPRFLEHEHRTITNEIDFVITKDAIVTVQYDTIPVLEDFWHECEGKDPSVRSQYGKTPIHLLHYLVRHFYATSLRELDVIQEKIDVIEEEVFVGREKEILADIALLKRNVLDFRRAAKPQLMTLESLTTRGVHFFGDRVKPLLTDLVGEYLRVWNLLENHKETLDALYETNNSLLAAKTNNTVLAFTVLAFMSFIPMAIASVYGMNIVLPLAERENAFWVLASLMIGLTLFVFGILKWKKLI